MNDVARDALGETAGIFEGLSDIMAGVAAVSYTHLDVYKRQI